MRSSRFAIFGAGFWSRYQLAAWKELDGARCVAIYNRTRGKAETLAREFGVPGVYDDPEELLAREKPDFVDVITHPDTHVQYVELAAAHRVPVICQKPMAPTLEEAERVVRVCREAGVPFVIHENFRWQTPIRQLKSILDSGAIGRPFRSRIEFCTSFPVFQNQPYLKELERCIIADLGIHILDVARFLFGEVERLYCQTSRVHPDIKGEDVATIVLAMGGVTCTCEISFASRLAVERFPQTFTLIEGERGSIELGHEYLIRVTTADGTSAQQCPPPYYRWADPAYAVAQTSMVACNADILRALQTGRLAETDAADNIKTVRLVYAAYESAARGEAIRLAQRRNA